MTLALDQVSKWYGNVVAVNGVSCTIGPGVTGLLGPNGAGKTTLLHLVVGLLRPSSGRITLHGEPVWQHPPVYRHLGFVAESEAVQTFLTGAELVRLRAELMGLPEPGAATDRALAMVDLTTVAHRPLGTYSKGMRQRARIAAALVHEPTVLVLDEPFNGMDPKQRVEMMRMLTALGQQGHAILVSSHILEEVDRLADTVLVLVGGRLAASGSPRTIRQLMTDRPHTFLVRSSDDRRLAAALIREPTTTSVECLVDGLQIRTADLGSFSRRLPSVARAEAITLHELTPSDESLEHIFAYLMSGT